MVVARVVSEHMVKLDVVDLIRCLSLEAPLNDVELLLRHLHAEVVEDGAEASERNEAASALVLVLEVGLDQQAAVLHIGAETLEHGDENAFLRIIENVLRVEDGGRDEASRHLCRVLLERLVGKDVVELIAESHIVDEASIIGHGKVTLQALELSRRKSDTLPVKSTSEFLCCKVALSKSVVILEEFKQPDSILFDDLLDLLHKLLMLVLAIEVGEAFDVGGFGTGSWAIDDILEAVGVTQELGIFHVVVFVAVNEGNSFGLSLVNLETQRVQHLAEDLRRHFEAAKGVSILEEALCVEAVSPDKLTESLYDLGNGFALGVSRLASAVHS